jgi:hypothetical protein
MSIDVRRARLTLLAIAGFGRAIPTCTLMMNMFWEPLGFELPLDPSVLFHRSAEAMRR